VKAARPCGLGWSLGAIMLLLVVVLQVGTPTSAAQARNVAWTRYDVDLNVQPNGSVQVSETQTIQFHGTYQQGLRVIPTDRLTGIDNVSVGEDVGGTTAAYRPGLVPATNSFRTTSTDQGLQVDWWFPPTTDASRTFVLRYTAQGAIRVYDAGDQLQWKAVYADRDGPTEASTVTVHLPGDVAPADLKTSFSHYVANQESRVGALPSVGSGQESRRSDRGPGVTFRRARNAAFTGS
jgi:hypothetical protein